MSEAVTTDGHTPGPWHLLKPDSPCIEAPDGNVAIVNLARASKADAYLISAAPDLLALAKQYAKECSECGGTGMDSLGMLPCLDCEDIQKVIAKAEGRL